MFTGSGERFSFFPNETETSFFQTAEVSELVEVFRRQSDMSARFAHELMSLGRAEDLKAVLREVFADTTLLELFLTDLSLSAILMRATFNIEESKAAAYVHEVIALVNEVNPGFVIPVHAMLEVIQNAYITYKSRQN